MLKFNDAIYWFDAEMVQSEIEWREYKEELDNENV